MTDVAVATENAVDIEALRAEVIDLVETVDKTYFKLGGRLSMIAREGVFGDFGFDTFEEYIEEELNFARRKAYYLIQIYERATELDVETDILAEIGWTKAREILAYVDTREQFDEWADRAKRMSQRALSDSLKAELLGKEIPKKGKDEDGNTTEEIDGELFHYVDFALSDEQYKNVRLALQRAGEIAGSDKTGHLIDMISLEFLSNNASVSDLGEKLADWANRGLIEIEEEGEE